MLCYGMRQTAFSPISCGYAPDDGWNWESKVVASDVALPADQAIDDELRRVRKLVATSVWTRS